MINRLLLTCILVISFSSHAYAGFWDVIIGCITDPCNCGISDKERYELWGSQSMYKGYKNYLCPPWNKDGGRGDHICLAGQDYPPNFTWYFQRICAESTTASTYFEPKIRIRDQECNNVACWVTENTLKWDGECKTLAGPYGLPLTRVCARIALPADPLKGTPADPGYTEGKHLTFEGIRENDETVIGADGQPVVLRVPKLCVYLDPAFLGSGDDGLDIDLMDLDPNKQPFHKTKEIHPVVKVIIFFFDQAIQLATSPFDMLSSLFNMMNGVSDALSPLSEIFKFVGWVIQMVGQVIVDILKEVGQMNRVVSSNDYGCVNIPLGPFPPPYCHQVAPFYETAVTQNICPLGADGLPIQSTENEPCVVSTLQNNFIRNSIRVGFDNFIPLCRNGEDPMLTDTCVAIDNIDAFSSAAGLHLLSARRDIIKPCSTAAAGAPCVRSKIPHTCSVSAGGCEDGFRIVYGTNIGQSSTPGNYFLDDLNDCPSSSSVACQTIWGINTGEFIDVTLLFPSIQRAIDIGPISTTFSLASKGVATNFSASIVRSSTFLANYEFTQDPGQICVFDSDDVVGCQKRAPFTNPLVYSCDSATGGITCTTDYFKPSFIASITSGTDTVSALVEPLTVYNNPATILNSTVNLAGYEFNSFVTDDTFVEKPFSGAKSPNPASIYGIYKNNTPPVNANGTVNNNAVYIKGLEYINNEYYRGGKFACLEPRSVERCPTNTKICVLTALDNKDIVDCSVFLTKSRQYGGLGMCRSLIGCVLTEYIPGLSGGPGVGIHTCTSGITCYTNPVEVCTVTTDPGSRITPSPSYGSIIPDSQYYDILGTPGYSYDKKISVLRNKTPFEMNLCVSIPQPVCQAVTSSGSDFADWTLAAVGEYSTGTCPVGTRALKPMQRYCLLNSTSKTVALEDLGSGPECGSGCPAVTTYLAQDGNATWTSAPVGGTSTGTCKPGWRATGSLSRQCLPGSPPFLSTLLPSQVCAP